MLADPWTILWIGIALTFVGLYLIFALVPALLRLNKVFAALTFILFAVPPAAVAIEAFYLIYFRHYAPSFTSPWVLLCICIGFFGAVAYMYISNAVRILHLGPPEYVE